MERVDQRSFLHRSGRPRANGGRGAAFTLLETLVVVAIIAVLLAVLFPALRSARNQMKKLRCASNMRNLTMHFQLFVDGTSETGKGESEQLGPSRLHINDFQDSAYRIDEFWDLKHTNIGELSAQNELMLCPAGPRKLIKTKGFPCSRKAIGPVEDVTLAVNMRLYKGTFEYQGEPHLATPGMSKVQSRILDHAYVPLVIDVDAEAAIRRGLEPFYTAPPLPNTNDAYSDGFYWMPSGRHAGQSNVGFVGGHVLSSSHPEKELWNWDYRAEVRN
ncbi:MAG: type II secretion system protein [bacterium]|nr:type II secretion system protein [bacterium]